MAKHKTTEERYAIKAFSKLKLNQNREKNVESLKKEIKILRDLDHPNCIKLCEVHETENSLYLVMELLSGGEIQNVNRLQVLPLEKRKVVIKSCLEALVYLESKQIMHRDLKPSNIIFKNSEKNPFEIKLVDFGLSDYTHTSTFIHKKCGTPGFIAPEVINLRSKTVDYNTSCDMFSLGMIFFCLISGRLPYDGENFNQVYENNRIGFIDFEMLELEVNIIESELDLLKSMLHIDQNVRITPSEALEHPYFTTEERNHDEHFYSIGLDEFNQKKNDNDGDHGFCLRQKIVKYNKKFKFIKNIKDKNKVLLPTIDKSLVYNKNPLINGKIDTYVSSKYSSNNSCRIVSLQTGRNSRKDSNNKTVRDSIYKRALTKMSKDEMSNIGILGRSNGKETSTHYIELE